MSGNQALNINSVVGAQADWAITDHGSDWYWAVCAVMTVSTLTIMGMSFTKPKSHRLFHYITAGITMVAAIAYYSMGAGLGQVPIGSEFAGGRPQTNTPGPNTGSGYGTREIFYVRYIDWFVTTPLLLLDLLLTAGMPVPTIAMVILADEIMIVTGLAGALTQTSYKWGYWLFGMLAMFYIAYSLAFDARRHASAIGGHAYKTFLSCGVLTVGIWFLYPIAWGLSEGGNVIHPDSEAIFYGILDIIAKPVFGAMLLFGHRNIDPAELGIRISDYAATGPGATTREKVHNGGHHGVADGARDGVVDGHHGHNNVAV